jgi:N-glycosylase/DNA lyase
MISKIESAINKICAEISLRKKRENWFSVSEDNLLFELVSCILGSRVSYEIAQLAATKLKQSGLLIITMSDYSIQPYQSAIESVLKSPLKHMDWGEKTRRYPFPKLRANHIARTVGAIYSDGDSITNLLKSCKSAKIARKMFVDKVVGFGPKQASLFLRNIGFTNDLAILDSHVLAFMSMKGLLKKGVRSIPTLNLYERHEMHLIKYANNTGWPLGYLDEAIWIVMRVYKTEAVA